MTSIPTASRLVLCALAIIGLDGCLQKLDSNGTGTGDATATDSCGGGEDDGHGGLTGGCGVDCPDLGQGVVECDVWAQDCPRGEKCMPWARDGGSAWDATKCSPVDPEPGEPGEPCTVVASATFGHDSCREGALCWDVDQVTQTGTCVDFCTGSPEAPGCAEPGNRCVVSNGGVLTVCLPECDPLLQSCPDGDACLPSPSSGHFVCAPDTSGLGGARGEPCSWVNDCDPGHFCAASILVPGCASVDGCCAPYCDLDDPSCLEADLGEECIPFEQAAGFSICQANVGGCVRLD